MCVGEGLPSYFDLMVDIGVAIEQKLYAAGMASIACPHKWSPTDLDARGVAQTMGE